MFLCYKIKEFIFIRIYNNLISFAYTSALDSSTDNIGSLNNLLYYLYCIIFYLLFIIMDQLRQKKDYWKNRKLYRVLRDDTVSCLNLFKYLVHIILTYIPFTVAEQISVFTTLVLISRLFQTTYCIQYITVVLEKMNDIYSF